MSHDTSAMHVETLTYLDCLDAAPIAEFRSSPPSPYEFVNWRDTGCELHPSCLNCPEETCIYDEPRGMQVRRKLARTLQALSLVRSEGLTVEEVAQVMQCSPRTIQRYLANPPS